ncbi:MAG: hypothetical protein K6A37_08655 [Saccharofermentans sp.]|nr:hypothetical protein [Saccharofermentans sp.]
MKKAIAMVITSALMLSFPGCSAKSDVEVNAVADPVAGGEEACIVPFLAEHIENEWTPELDYYLFGMTDLEGNTVYEPQFTSVNLIESCGVYIVGGEVEGKTFYGLLSLDGEDYTGLIYDGAYYDPAMEEGEEGMFNMTVAGEAGLHLTRYDSALTVADETDLVVDVSSLPYPEEYSGLSVCHMVADGAVLVDRNEFYPHYVLVDISTGEMLNDLDGDPGKRTTLFGDLIIMSDISGEELKVYDYTGECTVDGQGAMGLRLSDYRFAAVYDGRLEVVDTEGYVVEQMDVDQNTRIDTSCGHIVVCENGVTSVYDENLDPVSSDLDIDLDDGYLLGDYDDEFCSYLYFVSFDDDVVINLMTGQTMDTMVGYHYNYENGYIFADNRGDGNTDDHRWYLYDEDFNTIFNVSGIGKVFYDRLSEDMYICAIENGETSMYSCDYQTRLFVIDGNYGYYTCTAFCGRFMMTDGNEVILVDSSAQELFSYTINS